MRGQSSNILYGARSFSLDIISKIAFCGSINSIDHPDFKHPILVDLNDALPAFQASKFLPWVYGPLHLFSEVAIGKFWHSMACLLGFRNKLTDVVMDLQSDQKTDATEPCILHTLMDPTKHTAEEKLSLDDLVGEAQTMIAGGVESVAHSAVYALVFAAQDKEISRRLREELVQVWPDPQTVPDLTELENLPFLTAVIKESLRLAPGISTPLTRVVPRGGATIGGQFIPAGVSHSRAVILLRNRTHRSLYRRLSESPLECCTILKNYSRMPTCSNRIDGSIQMQRNSIAGLCRSPRDLGHV